LHCNNNKYPELGQLEVGESVDLPSGPVRKSQKYLYTLFYEMAKAAGIRVSVRTLGEDTVRVTRIRLEGPPASKLKIPREDLLKLYRSGKLSNEEIAKRAGVTASRVRAIAKEAGEPVNRLGRRLCPKINKKDLEALYLRSKLSAFAIAKKLGADQATVRRLLRSHGIELRDDRKDPRYEAVRALKVGESVDLPRLDPAHNSAEVTARGYRDAARTAGIMVSVRKFGKDTFRVTRKA
jgi:hypothetical protein